LERPHTFTILDGLRGVAAIAVIDAHLGRFFSGRELPHVSLAVDFFFMLSGFVLTFAYQKRLDEGWSTWSFFKTRMIRLYPLLALGMVMGFAFVVFQSHFGKDHMSVKDSLVLLVLGLLMLPIPLHPHWPWPAMFRLLVPAWSLFYEVIMNLLHALFLRRRSTGFLLAVTACSLVIWVAATVRFGYMGFGVDRHLMVFGFARAAFSYVLGCLLFRWWQRIQTPRNVPPALCALALLAVLFLPWSTPWREPFNFALVTLLFPAILLAGALSVGGTRITPVARVLGTTSYAIYVLHVAVGEFFEQVWKLVLHRKMEATAPWSGMVYVVVLFLLALAIDKVYDQPVRAWLKRRLA
jgi:peptidoglycan/LPS O-acetylase OafA/YrhL